MSQLHPLEENDVYGEFAESKHIDYLYEIAAIVEEHGTEEDKKEITRELKKRGLIGRKFTVNEIIARFNREDDDEFDGMNRDSSFINVEENVY